MTDLSVLIAARNEVFLARTVAGVLEASGDGTEVIVVLDGAPADPPLAEHPRLRVLTLPASIGQRAAVNLAAREARGTFVMKLDAHCAIDPGFDTKLIAPYASGELTPDTTTIPRLFNLHAFDWQCLACGHRTYQGARPTECGTCHARQGFERAMVWQPRQSRRTDFTRFDSTLHFQYWHDFQRRPAVQAEGDLANTLCNLGACWFLRRDRFWKLGGLDEQHGSWGQMGVEISLKSWLSGGRQVVNKRTWFSHMFRTHGGPEWGFPYPLDEHQVQAARRHSREMWMNNRWEGQVRPLSWVLEKFWPVPDWCEPAGAASWEHVQAAGKAFTEKREVAA
jgi:glycosyltransferase involved in cell wall biosynthesis